MVDFGGCPSPDDGELSGEEGPVEGGLFVAPPMDDEVFEGEDGPDAEGPPEEGLLLLVERRPIDEDPS